MYDEHYKKLAIEPITYCDENGLKYAESCVIKYTTRHQDKGKRIDIEKAIQMLEYILKRDYPPEPPSYEMGIGRDYEESTQPWVDNWNSSDKADWSHIPKRSKESPSPNKNSSNT